MDRGWYSGNYLFNVEVGNWEEEEEQKTILCGGGTPHISLHEILWEPMNLPLCSHWHVCSEKP